MLLHFCCMGTQRALILSCTQIEKKWQSNHPILQECRVLPRPDSACNCTNETQKILVNLVCMYISDISKMLSSFSCTSFSLARIFIIKIVCIKIVNLSLIIILIIIQIIILISQPDVGICTLSHHSEKPKWLIQSKT